MINKALKKSSDETKLIFQSDQECHYQNARYQKRLSDTGIHQSMTWKRNYLDNTVIENFFGLLKSELLYLSEFHSFEEFQIELVLYLEFVTLPIMT